MRNVLSLALVACAALGCQDNKVKYPDSVVASAAVADDELHMSVFAETESTTTTISVFPHRHVDGYAQYLQLSDEDSLSVQSDTGQGEFSEVAVPSQSDPVQVYYSTELEDASTESSIEIAFSRADVALISAQLNVLETSDFTVTADTDPAVLQSALHVEWTPVSDYEYQLKFVFTCTIDGNTVGFRKRFPGYSDVVLESPFDLDLAQFSPPPEGATDCEVSVALIAEQDQAALQSFDEVVLNVKSARIQETLIPLAID